MGKDVFNVTYEVVGSGVQLAESHVAAVREATNRCVEIAVGLGADGYRPGYRGSGMGSLIFKDGQLRPGLKRFSPRGQEQGVDFIPRKDKSGSHWREAMEAAPHAPTDRDIVSSSAGTTIMA